MENFKAIISSDQLVLVDFYATWCGPCKMMHPVLDSLKQQLGEKVRILKVDVDKNRATALEYRVQSVPTLALFKNGKMLWREAGAQPLDRLLATVQSFL